MKLRTAASDMNTRAMLIWCSFKEGDLSLGSAAIRLCILDQPINQYGSIRIELSQKTEQDVPETAVATDTSTFVVSGPTGCVALLARGPSPADLLYSQHAPAVTLILKVTRAKPVWQVP